ncbi:hypothetical protein E4T52_06898 [Aureobasidium sp. EXF-3400]|nr:hypothetical protein E4T51_00185 [Aureobasidium sp. EXF-12344]KAI4778123.1 hypothetical protein E4T52_06898 [Aureobasidium sp. EXF-3400]
MTEGSAASFRRKDRSQRLSQVTIYCTLDDLFLLFSKFISTAVFIYTFALSFAYYIPFGVSGRRSCYTVWKWKMRKSKDPGLLKYPSFRLSHIFLYTTLPATKRTYRRRSFADKSFYSGYLPLIIYLGYTRSVPRPSLIKYGFI